MKKNKIGCAVFVSALSVCLLAVVPAFAGLKFEIEIWCPTDVDTLPKDGVIDSLELLQALGDLGPCDPSCLEPGGSPCAGDVNGNCYVGALDMAYVRAHLGPCPCLGDLDEDGDRDADDLAAMEDLLDLGLADDYCMVDIDDNGWVDAVDQLAVLLTLSDDPDAEIGRADVDQSDSGVPDTDDLLAVQDAEGRDCRADLDRDGDIDLDDLEILVGLEEECP